MLDDFVNRGLHGALHHFIPSENQGGYENVMGKVDPLNDVIDLRHHFAVVIWNFDHDIQIGVEFPSPRALEP